MWRNVLFGGNVGYRARLGRRKKRRLAATGAALAAITASVITGVPVASAGSSETVIVTASGLLSPVTAVLQVGGSVQTQFHLINGVLASIPTTEADALPGIVVTPDAQVSLQDVPEFDRPAATSGPMNLNQSGLVLPALAGLPVSLSSARPFDTWNAALWSGLAPGQLPSNGWTWAGVTWNGAAWNGWTYGGVAWNRWAWGGAYWNSVSWHGSAWNGTPWAGSAWNCAAWGPYWDTKSWNGG